MDERGFANLLTMRLQIYGQEPLEDGEIDTKRARSFTLCVRKDYKSRRKVNSDAVDAAM